MLKIKKIIWLNRSSDEIFIYIAEVTAADQQNMIAILVVSEFKLNELWAYTGPNASLKKSARIV